MKKLHCKQEASNCKQKSCIQSLQDSSEESGCPDNSIKFLCAKFGSTPHPLNPKKAHNDETLYKISRKSQSASGGDREGQFYLIFSRQNSLRKILKKTNSPMSSCRSADPTLPGPLGVTERSKRKRLGEEMNRRILSIARPAAVQSAQWTC